jgi:bifunctional non-homologous end joining protein LigD
MLPAPMLLRPGRIPTGTGWAFEVKYDGFRAIVSTENGLQVRSRRGWNMAERVPELRNLRPGLVLDGELVAFNQAGAPHWPLVCERVLHNNTSITVSFVTFDVLRVNGHDLTASPWSARRAVLEELGVETRWSRLTDVFDDGQVLFDAVCKHGLEGVVAKRATSLYRAGQRGWIKIKNPTYWRRDEEIESLRRSLERTPTAF